MKSRQQTSRSCNMASTFPESATPGPMQQGMGGHAEYAEQSIITTHCPPYFSSEAALVRRLAALQRPAHVSPWSCAGCLAMVQKASAKPNLHGSRARSQHLTTMRLTPVHHAP